AAEDATVIFGTVYDDSLGDALRVTVVATGLNGSQTMQKDQPQLIWRQATGTNDASPTMTTLGDFAPTSPAAAMSHSVISAPTTMVTGQPVPVNPAVDYGQFDIPKVFRNSRDAVPPSLGADSSPQAKAMLEKGADYYEIPAFLRKQAD
ncbi:MAG: cell division protein FtsZ, partial [Burkholderiaceae bacterium]|nr:cell division protein FtsZ [Burkholderiaceae bacterium]